jgi:hypothetical protein
MSVWLVLRQFGKRDVILEQRDPSTAAVAAVLSTFLNNATPEALGRLAGCIVTHLARSLAERPR